MIALDFLDPTRPVAVLGMGISGRATVAALKAAGLTVFAHDDRSSALAPALSLGAAALAPETEEGASRLRDCQVLVAAPGIPLTHPAPNPVIAQAQRQGVPVVGDVEVLARALPPHQPLIGITGTNGKSTTTALVHHILADAGQAPVVGGNLGPPVLGLEIPGPQTPVVLELSSYQLDLVHTPCLAAAAWINLTPDHLARHGGLDGYIAAKRRIIALRRPGAPLVIGVDDAATSAVAEAVAQAAHGSDDGPVIRISTQGPIPQGPAVFAREGHLWEALDGPAHKVLDLAPLPTLRGSHNAQNIAVAWALARQRGVEPSTLARAIHSFPGLAHRQALVAVHQGVTWINDSKATNAEAAVHALRAYPAIRWILGGQPKETGLDGLQEDLGNVRAAYLIGQAQSDFAQWLMRHAAGLPVRLCTTLDQAVAQAAAEAEAGDTVLLSPACASWDQFASFEARGDAFAAKVKDMIAAAG